MYSRAFGNGIESDGILREVERRYDESGAGDMPVMSQHRDEPPAKERGIDLKRIFKNISIEDLLLLAIGVLLLLDGEPDNDILLIAIVFLLFF